MKKFVLWLIIFLMLFTSGCIEKNANASVDDDGKTNNYIVYDLGEIPDDLIQLNYSSPRGNDLLLALFEGLVKKDEYGEIVPGLAEDWTISEDGITYVFNLRKNAKWSDGTEIKAEDFVSFFKEILNPKIDNIYAYQLYCIFGSEEYNKGKKSFANVAIKANDHNTLQIRLNAPSNYFLEILSQPIYALRKLGNDLENYKKTYKNIAYSGPFVIDNLSYSEGLILVKNSNYYETYSVRSEKLYIALSRSSENALASYNTSKINIFLNPPIAETKDLVIDGEAEMIPINSGSSINFNLKRGANISRADIRKAISSAIDREKIASEILNGTVISAYSYIPNSEENYSSTIKEDSFAKKSDSDLQNNENKNLKLIYLNSIENKKVCEAIEKNIEEALNLNVTCIGYNEEDFKETMKNGDYDMAKVDYALLYNDPLSLFEPWTSASEFNLFGYNNADFNNMILKAKIEKDDNKRKDLINEAEKIFLNDMPSTPLYFYNAVLCKKSNVEGVYVTAEGNVKLDRAYIK